MCTSGGNWADPLGLTKTKLGDPLGLTKTDIGDPLHVLKNRDEDQPKAAVPAVRSAAAIKAAPSRAAQSTALTIHQDNYQP